MARSEQKTMVRLTVAGLALAAVSALIGLAAWQFPRSTAPTAAEHTSVAPDSRDHETAATATPSRTTASATVTYLDTLGPHTGGADLVPARDWPAAELNHPIVIRCPSNETGDKVRSVTYALNDRYRTLAATVRPHYTADREATTYVTVIGGFRQRDGVLDRREIGRQLGATMAAAQPLMAEVRDADEITIRVQCETPDGMIILEDAHVTRG